MNKYAKLKPKEYNPKSKFKTKKGEATIKKPK